MKNSMLIRGLAALAVCALLVPCAVNAKDKVERPFKSQMTGTLVASLFDGSYQAIEFGRATHTGVLENEYSGILDLVNLQFVSGAGFATAANGDQSFWELAGQSAGQWTGGTGRFEGATGTFTWVTTDIIVSVDYDSMTMTLVYSYTMTGTVAY